MTSQTPLGNDYDVMTWRGIQIRPWRHSKAANARHFPNFAPKPCLTRKAVAPLILVRFWKENMFWKLESRPQTIFKTIYTFLHGKTVKIAMARGVNFAEFMKNWVQTPESGTCKFSLKRKSLMPCSYWSTISLTIWWRGGGDYASWPMENLQHASDFFFFSIQTTPLFPYLQSYFLSHT